jgi:hypothetical protein
MQTDFKIGAGVIVKRKRKGILSPYLLTPMGLILGAGVIGTIRPREFESDLNTPQSLKIGAGIIGTAANRLNPYRQITYDFG